MSLVNDINTRFVSEKSVEKKPLREEDEDDGEGEGTVRDLSSTVSEFIQNINSDDDSREGSDSRGGDTSQVSSILDNTEVEAFNGLEAKAEQPLVLNQKMINGLSEMYPDNAGVPDLQASLRETIQSGKNVEDMPEEIKDQLKLIFNQK